MPTLSSERAWPSSSSAARGRTDPGRPATLMSPWGWASSRSGGYREANWNNWILHSRHKCSHTLQHIEMDYYPGCRFHCMVHKGLRLSKSLVHAKFTQPHFSLTMNSTRYDLNPLFACDTFWWFSVISQQAQIWRCFCVCFFFPFQPLPSSFWLMLRSTCSTCRLWTRGPRRPTWRTGSTPTATLAVTGTTATQSDDVRTHFLTATWPSLFKRLITPEEHFSPTVTLLDCYPRFFFLHCRACSMSVKQF